MITPPLAFRFDRECFARPPRPAPSDGGAEALGFALRLRVEDLGFRVEDLGFRVEDLGFRVEGLGFRVEGLGFRI